MKDLGAAADHSEDDGLETRTLLWPLLTLMYAGVEEAVEKVRGHFHDHKLTYSPYAFSGLVRCHLHDFLDATKAATVGFKIVRLPLDGIELDYQGCRIKAWKGADELPPPRSDTNETFCHQPSLFALGTPGAPPRRLVVTWALTGDFGLKSLFLICPKWDGADEVHWTKDIPHPATMIAGAADFAGSEDLAPPSAPQAGIGEQ